MTAGLHQNKDTIYLTGFMGSGKTTAGALLAPALGRSFVDTDAMIEYTTGMKVREIFERRGETYFRDTESRVLQKIAGTPGTVAALGGGAVIRENNRKLIAETGTSICLHVPADILFRRLKHHSGRPLLNGLTAAQKASEIETLLLQRMPFYRSADLFLELVNETPSEICEMITTYLKRQI